MRRTRKRRRKGGGLLDQLKKGVNAVGVAVRKAAGFEKKPKTRALTPEEVAKLEQMTKDEAEKRRGGRGTNAAAAAAGPVVIVPDDRGFYPRDEDGTAIHSVTGTPYGPDGLTINREDRDGQYHALGLRSRNDLGTVARAIHDDEVAWAREHGRAKMGGKRRKSRRKRRRKRRRSRRGGKWCKCSDLEKICEKLKAREKRSEASAQKYRERKEAKPQIVGYRVVVPGQRSPPKGEMSEGVLLGGRRTRRRRKRRRTRRRRRRTRRKIF